MAFRFVQVSFHAALCPDTISCITTTKPASSRACIFALYSAVFQTMQEFGGASHGKSSCLGLLDTFAVRFDDLQHRLLESFG